MFINKLIFVKEKTNLSVPQYFTNILRSYKCLFYVTTVCWESREGDVSANQKLAGWNSLRRFIVRRIQTKAYGKNCRYLAWQIGQAEVKVYTNRQEVCAGNQKVDRENNVAKTLGRMLIVRVDLGPELQLRLNKPG